MKNKQIPPHTYRICSWDVGIKNLAYCIIEKTNNVYKIKGWDSINLLEDENKICRCYKKNKTLCGNRARFYGSINNNIKYNNIIKTINKEIPKNRYPHGKPRGIYHDFFETEFLIFFLTSTASREVLTQKENKKLSSLLNHKKVYKE